MYNIEARIYNWKGLIFYNLDDFVYNIKEKM